MSNSEIQTFLQCRRRWWLAYYRGLRPAKQKGKGPLALGTRVHEALAAWYSLTPRNPFEVYTAGVIRDRALVTEEELKDFESEAELGRRMLEGYFEWVHETGADAGLTVVSDEEEIRVPSAVPGVDLIGRLDLRVVRDLDEARLFMDHKTAASLTDPLKTLPMDPQMLHYHVLEMLKAQQDGTKARCDGAIYNMLKKVKRTAAAKPPFFAREEVRHNIEQVRNYYRRLTGIILTMRGVERDLDEAARNGDEHAHHSVVWPTPTRDCSWKCEFFAACPMFDDGSYVEGLLEAAYVKGDPYDRYDKESGGSSEG